MANILVAGFLHETNTFNPQLTLLEDFEQADAYPKLTLGNDCFDVFKNNNIALTGFIEQAQHLGHRITPVLWCSAPPFGIVTQRAYDHIVNTLLDGIKHHNNIDAIFLDLHGAMVCESSEDGEGELVKRIREIVGPDIPIATALDLHANITQDMYEQFDVIDIYRTYPHIDIYQTGIRVANTLDARLTLAKPLAKCFYKIPFLMPMNSQCTLQEPSKGIYQYLIDLNNEYNCSLAMALGFPLADIFDCGPAILGYGEDQEQLNQACKILYDYTMSHKHEFKLDVLPADEAAKQAADLANNSELPIVIADTQDNPGGGGSSDTTGVLRALIKSGASNAVVALMHDPAAAEHAHAIGLNNEMVIDLGGRSNIEGDTPFHGKFTVTTLTDGRFIGTGAYYHNVEFDLGAMAVLTIEGVRVIVSSKKMQAADQAIFRHVGIEPCECSILALKSSVHFRADFSDIAKDILVAIAPGFCTADLRQLNYQHLRSDIQLL